MGEPAFSEKLRDELQHGKYTSWAADLTEDEVCGLLWMIGEFGVRKHRLRETGFFSKIEVSAPHDARIKCALFNVMRFVNCHRFGGEGAIDKINKAMKDFQASHPRCDEND